MSCCWHDMCLPVKNFYPTLYALGVVGGSIFYFYSGIEGTSSQICKRLKGIENEM